VLLTAKQLAEELNVNTQVVWRNAREGKFPHYRMGSTMRFDLSEVLKTMRKNEDERASRKEEIK
jgi:excisionase family DNA binding protein